VPKRAFDIAATLLFAPLVIALITITAIALAIDLRGNPFFLQRRIGRHGRPFTMFKLRTMRHPRPGEQPNYHVDDWATFIFSPPGHHDPRTTRLGAFARSNSLDELPNLLNVILGQMSLVGPRPELPEIVAQYPERYHARHTVLPGITGLAQVHGRSDLTYEESASYDLEYVQAHTLMGDLRILLQTARLALTGKGAR
jgi:lipopolysaccharide/colanic/teichoic acid biosynthesis glycosyltransferase